MLLAPEEAQGAGEEVWARVEKEMRGHFGAARTQGPEVIFHRGVPFAKMEKEEEEEEEEEINEMTQMSNIFTYDLTKIYMNPFWDGEKKACMS